MYTFGHEKKETDTLGWREISTIYDTLQLIICGRNNKKTSIIVNKLNDFLNGHSFDSTTKK